MFSRRSNSDRAGDSGSAGPAWVATVPIPYEVETWRIKFRNGTTEDIECSGWYRVQASSGRRPVTHVSCSTGDQIAFCAGRFQMIFRIIRFDLIAELELLDIKVATD